ncbi:histidine triad nucleotide-binding protein [Bombiscardovia nodaiensis]|uniref:Histidine triad nucleotide-binding protein n=1 Tax=Bombiscardovia nodaiensis TaxID=2932181 RepID=A0ABN6SCV6_9BIFI|nr:histidine triad nucleotide-binding protein [Bombiscardovia nodaiensis]
MSEQQTVDDCLFCKIIAGQVPSNKVYEDERVYAFKDIEPKAKVHVLVVPKQHYANIAKVAQADPELLAHMVEVAQGIADQTYRGQFRLICNTGELAGQSVFHAHAHVLTGEDLRDLPMSASDQA